MMKKDTLRHVLAALAALSLLGSAVPFAGTASAAATKDISDTMTWGTLRIGGGQRTDTAELQRIVQGRVERELRHIRFGDTDVQLLEADRHPDRGEEVDGFIDTRFCRGEVVNLRNAPNASRKPCEAGGTVAVQLLCPRAPDGGK